MEQLKDVLAKTVPTPTPTNEARVVHLPVPNLKKVWSCERCNEQYPAREWEKWWEVSPQHVGLCLRCRRKEEADAIRHIRGNAHQILIRAGFSEVLAAKTFRDIKTKGVFSMERRAEVKEIAFSIFDSKQRTKRGVCFIGPVGTGKTQWATLMAKRYVRKGWQSVPALVAFDDPLHAGGDDASETSLLRGGSAAPPGPARGQGAPWTPCVGPRPASGRT